ncbi:U2 snRNP-associated SURP motif-containing protein-like [Anneissia japonica]|uniref:U2 snRNP-associated SURP motif-containing protein-like n=1 Tax=Anneissia japonica TaxID=1529436 RepID=UPI0014256048|nr:U2 snRNP-associated SURP motif-containing protein-like [Anneissia japonica]
MADKHSRMKGLNPNSMKGISHNKLKAFSVGQMNIGKKKSKKEEEEARKKHDEKATAKVFEEFVASFEDSGSSMGKAFIRGSTINPETKEEKTDHQTGKLYKPSSKISESILLKKQEEAKKAEKAAQQEQAKKKKEKEKNKSKSNLENFLEELKVIQAEREIRHKLKKEIAEHSNKHTPKEPKAPLLATPDMRIPIGMEDYAYGSHDTGDPQTTNIFLGSLNPKMTEEMLCQEFGKYGPLASVKIMWPRTDEERSRNRNCGFVAYMNRKDAERGMKNIDGKMIMEYEMKLGWGKSVPIPPHPVFIPPQMLQLTLPPPPSGLPFNAQPKDKRNSSRTGQGGDDDLKKTLKDAVVKVVIPTERPLLHLIHRMIEFVVREGPMFEAMIMNREINNPLFRFLFENTSPAHVYYRWKLYSILQGDSPTHWKTKEFRMFHGGSYWRPPPLNPYLHGMPEALTGERPPRQATPPPPQIEEVKKRGTLSNHQRDKLEDMLRNLTMERQKISDTMVYCLDHGESAEEIVECISESLSILQTPIPKKIGRLFLVSDILFNSSAKVANASYYRKYFEARLPGIFIDLHKTHQSIQQRLKAEHFKNRVMACFRAWEDWAIYPNELLVRLQNVFLGLVGSKKGDGPNGDVEMLIEKTVEPELDGLPLVNESLDGQEIAEDIDGANIDVDGTEITEDLDGNPVENIDGVPEPGMKEAEGKFKVAPSKWESVDASTLESQAMTTSKWELLETLEEEKPKEVEEEEEDEDGVPIEEDEDDDEQESSKSYDLNTLKPLEMTEERRAKLREIEMKVMKFQDDVEGGRRSRKSGMSISEQVQKYRKKLLQKERERAIEKQRGKDRDKLKQREQERLRDYERAREKERIRLVDASDSDSDSSKQKRRRSSSGSASPVSSKRYRSGSRSPGSERRSSRHESREVSPVSYSDSPNIRKRSPSRKTHRSHRLQRSGSRSPNRRPRRSRSRSPSKRSYSPYRSKSHRKKSKHLK